VPKPGPLSGSVSQCLAFHLQLHLRVFLENLRIALPEQLRDPLVTNAAGAEPGGVCRSEIVDAKISNLRPAKRRMPNGLERFLKAVRIFLNAARRVRLFSSVRDFRIDSSRSISCSLSWRGLRFLGKGMTH
jgi:hypothetical protein